MLSVLRFAFQAVQGASQERLCPQTGGTWEGISQLREKRQRFYLWNVVVVLCWMYPAAPRQCLHGRVRVVPNEHCLDAASSTTLNWSSASEVSCCPPALLLRSPPAAPGEVWLGSVALPPPSQQPMRDWPSPASLSLVVGMRYPRLFGWAAAGGTTEDQLCSRWVWANPHCHQAEDPFPECGNHGIRCYFYANTNRWDNKGISHLHAF